MVRRRKENKVTGILTALLIGIVMFVGMGTMRVNAAEYRSGTIDPTTIQVGDTVYRGVQTTSNPEVAVCTKCHMVWIAYNADHISVELKKTEEHKDHAGSVGWDWFNWYFATTNTTYIKTPVSFDTPYTIMENGTLGYTITFNTNGGSEVAKAERQTKIPKDLPVPVKEGYDFAGWYTDEALTERVWAGSTVVKDITLYAKWTEHTHKFSYLWESDKDGHWHPATCGHSDLKEKFQKHSYGTTGEARYTCSICKYVDADKKAAVDASNKVLKADEVQVGDEIYFGNQLSPNKWITVCKKCHMIWITAADSDPDNIEVGIGIGSQKCYEVEHTDAHKDHMDDVGYANFNWYTTNSNSPLERNVPYTVMENDNLAKPVVKAKRTKANDQALSSKFSITTGKTIKVTWGKVTGADGYDVYMAYCKKGKYTVVKSVKSAKTISTTINKLDKKAVNQKENVKCYVVAYKKVDGKKVTIGKSITGHAVGKKNTTVTDAKKIQVSKSTHSLKKGKTAKIKATIVKKNNKLPLFGHTAKFRYDTSNKKVATVSKDGKITAKGKGTCYVYIYAVNGCAKKVKVTVK